MQNTRYSWSHLIRSWWIILLAVAAATAASFAASSRIEPRYRTSARFVISPNPQTVVEEEILRSLDILSRGSIIATYAEILRSRRVYDIAKAKLDPLPADLSGYQVTAFSLPEANILEVAVTGPNPATVLRLNEAIAREGAAYIDSVYRVYEINLLDSPRLPNRPISPDPMRNAMVAAALGAGLGLGLAILRRPQPEQLSGQNNLAPVSGQD